MKPDQFAKDFFDLWQKSASQMMKDPAYSQKMLEMMQQYGQLWQHTQSREEYETSVDSPAADDGAGADAVAELADRLELCERRIARLEQQLERLGKHPTNSGESTARRVLEPD